MEVRFISAELESVQNYRELRYQTFKVGRRESTDEKAKNLWSKTFCTGGADSTIHIFLRGFSTAFEIHEAVYDTVTVERGDAL